MKCPHPSVVKIERQDGNLYQRVPCGRCGACKSNRRADWSFRLKQELREAKNAYFITLTYDEQQLIYNADGDAILEKTDLQKFFKRLRKKQENEQGIKFRYYAVGEYGTQSDRPHYHAIAFNLSDRVLEELDEIWGFGHTKAGDVTPASIHYVTKFHVNPNQIDGKPNEFATMSRRPAIGATYIERCTKWHRENGFLFVINNGFKQRLPKYYKEKIWSETERRGIAHISEAQSKKNLKKTLKELEKKGYQKPMKELERRQEYHASKVKKKSNKNDIF